MTQIFIQLCHLLIPEGYKKHKNVFSYYERTTICIKTIVREYRTEQMTSTATLPIYSLL